MIINDGQPRYCVERASAILNRFRKSMNGAKILVLGVAYKNDIADYRESPAIRVIEELLKVGAEIRYYDPWVSHFRKGNLAMESEPELSERLLKESDLVVVAAAHSNVDYDFVQKHANMVFDTKNVMKNVQNRENIEVL